MDKKIWWLRHYTYTLALGVFIIFIFGVIGAGNLTNSTMSTTTGFPTGLAVKEITTESNKDTGITQEFKIISKDCALTPQAIYVNEGDTVILRFTAYDASGRLHKLDITGLDVTISTKGSELSEAKFIASKKGNFEYSDIYPCEALGYSAKGTLYVI